MEWNSIVENESFQLFTRVVISIILGFAIGLERELTSKFAGLRTHILVCLGSTIFTILSIYTFPTITAQGNPLAYGDPARIAAQILTGIGFIGGGTVLRHGSAVYGLTTAATLWISASIGMAIGAGELALGIVSTLFTLMVLILVRKLERHVIRKISKKAAKFKVTLMVNPENSEKMINMVSENFSNISEINYNKCERGENLEKISFVFNMFSKNPLKEVQDKLAKIDCIESSSIVQLGLD